MNSSGQFQMPQPLYVLAMAAIGGTIGWGLFQLGYSLQGLQGTPPQFWVWLFLIMCFFALLAIFFLPMWSLFIDLYKKQALREGDRQQEMKLIAILVISTMILAFLVLASTLLIESARTSIFDLHLLPKDHRERVLIVYICAFIVLLPVALSMLLVFRIVQQRMAEMPGYDQEESKLFELIHQIQDYRDILQNLLLVGGILLSMVPIITAGLRSVLVELARDEAMREIAKEKGIDLAEQTKVENFSLIEQADDLDVDLVQLTQEISNEYPIEFVVIYGLFYTFLLVLLYTPTHLAITEASRALRDKLCPLDSLSNLKDTVEKRELLDDVLQTKMGFGQNLKAGIATLVPLVTSLIVSLLGIEF